MIFYCAELDELIALYGLKLYCAGPQQIGYDFMTDVGVELSVEDLEKYSWELIGFI